MFVKYCDNLSDYRFLGNLEGGKLYYCCSRGRTISTEFPYKSSSFLIARSFFFLRGSINFARLFSFNVIPLHSQSYLFQGKSNTIHLVRKVFHLQKSYRMLELGLASIFIDVGFRGHRRRNWNYTSGEIKAKS